MVAIAITVVEIKPGDIDAAKEFGRSASDRTLNVPGIISYGWAENGKGRFTLWAVYKDREAAESAIPATQDLWAEIASMLVAPPQREILDGEWFSR